jgi:predicted NBD/HSP70 family sugar kinase
VNSQLDFLAIAIRNVIVTVSPEIIVLGGFLGLLYDHAAERLRAKVAAQTFAVLGENVEITRTSLGSSILLRGAAELVFTELLADPAGDWELESTATAATITEA